MYGRLGEHVHVGFSPGPPTMWATINNPLLAAFVTSFSEKKKEIPCHCQAVVQLESYSLSLPNILNKNIRSRQENNFDCVFILES